MSRLYSWRVDFPSDHHKPTPAAMQARAAAAVLEKSRADGASDGDVLEALLSPDTSVRETDIDFDASLAEFQELARSAGATIAAVLIQRRAKPDAATLVGSGKLDEIVADCCGNRCQPGFVRSRSDTIAGA